MSSSMKFLAAIPVTPSPAEGQCQHVFSTRARSGSRLEHSGLITDEQAAAIWKILMPPSSLPATVQQ
jgi:hypothetical protein